MIVSVSIGDMAGVVPSNVFWNLDVMAFKSALKVIARGKNVRSLTHCCGSWYGSV